MLEFIVFNGGMKLMLCMYILLILVEKLEV